MRQASGNMKCGQQEIETTLLLRAQPYCLLAVTGKSEIRLVNILYFPEATFVSTSMIGQSLPSRHVHGNWMLRSLSTLRLACSVACLLCVRSFLFPADENHGQVQLPGSKTRRICCGRLSWNKSKYHTAISHHEPEQKNKFLQGDNRLLIANRWGF